jgi:hypothetical protein
MAPETRRSKACPETGKRSHTSYAEALTELERLEQGSHEKKGSIYTCLSCGQFHISSQRFTILEAQRARTEPQKPRGDGAVSAPKLAPAPGDRGKVELLQMANSREAQELPTSAKLKLWGAACRLLTETRSYVDKAEEPETDPCEDIGSHAA